MERGRPRTPLCTHRVGGLSPGGSQRNARTCGGGWPCVCITAPLATAARGNRPGPPGQTPEDRAPGSCGPTGLARRLVSLVGPDRLGTTVLLPLWLPRCRRRPSPAQDPLSRSGGGCTSVGRRGWEAPGFPPSLMTGGSGAPGGRRVSPGEARARFCRDGNSLGWASALFQCLSGKYS